MLYTKQELIAAANNPSALLAIAKDLNDRVFEMQGALNDELAVELRDIKIEALEKKVRCLEEEVERQDRMHDWKNQSMLLTWQFLRETGQCDRAREWSRKQRENAND